MYFYRLHCLEWSGREVVSSILSARMGIHQLSLYPNPASSVVTIAYPFKKGTELKIFNALGELVIDKKMMKTASFTRIDVSHFRKGMYYVSINKSGLYFSVQ